MSLLWQRAGPPPLHEVAEATADPRPVRSEEYYADTHMPLVDKMLNLKRYEAARIVATPDGSQPPYYRIFEGYFEDMEQLQSSMATPEGQAAAEDIPNFATGGATLLICEIDA
jgi:uncharacterized protein (TIGR02118 family)